MTTSIIEIYVTKHALTFGIIKKTVFYYADTKNCRVANNVTPEFYHEGEYELDQEKALAKAEQMRVKKIKSLEKSLKKLQNLAISFEDQTT